VKRLREAKRLTFVELSRRLLEEHERHIPTLGLRQIEARRRRVDADDLVALAATFGVSPMDLLSATEPDDGPVSRSEVRRMIAEALDGR